MLPVVGSTLCCEVPPCFTFRMPRVVPDQRDKFENDELFRKLSRETEVRLISAAFAPGSFRLVSGSRRGSRQIGVFSRSDCRRSPFDACHFSLQIRYTGYRDRQTEERHVRFQADCKEGHADIVSTNFAVTLRALHDQRAYIIAILGTLSSRPTDCVCTVPCLSFVRNSICHEPGYVTLFYGMNWQSATNYPG